METNDILTRLNKEQQEAVLQTEGPVLILAGAGSGKTRVLVHRIAYLINVCGVDPYSILAITFTNKAADEMRSRVDDMIGFGSREIWVMTFHSCCVRILRRHAEEIGYTRYFTIYDTDDQLSVMKDIFKRRGIDTKFLKERTALGMISSAKNELVGPDEYARMTRGDYRTGQVADIYDEYQKRLRDNNAMDFDDLIMNTVTLFEQHPEILDLYRERFRYMMVDEYQDTNTAQFRFVSLLAGKYKNLCVVGDDDQSIYKFRGANIRNILNFEQIFPESRVIKLEQNYRSTQHILNCANEVIRNNRGRKSKRLWTENGTGSRVRFIRFENAYEEADFVAAEIGRRVRSGERSYKDFAVLYRTNAQSRLFEEKCLFLNVPYKLVGGVNFYSRREIKDVLAYLKTIDNAVDDVASTRIINVPRRGIGATTITKISTYAFDSGCSFFDAASSADRISSLSSATAKKVRGFTDFINDLRQDAKELSVEDLIKKILKDTGYRKELEVEDTEESRERLENIDELVSKAASYSQKSEHPTLSGFLEEVALIADIDTVDDGDDRVLLMTLHSAKGLEFPIVFMAGMEEGLFPSSMSIRAENPDEEIEEERRLCYVGITRAKEELIMTAAYARMVRGEFEPHAVSRFVREISRDSIDQPRAVAPKPAAFAPKGGLGPDMRNAINKSAYAPKPQIGQTEQGSSGSAAYSYSNPYRKKASSPAATSGVLSYGVGDKVRHKKFGLGTVTNIRDGGRDYEVTVDFPAWGVKKMFAAFAKLEKAED